MLRPMPVPVRRFDRLVFFFGCALWAVLRGLCHAAVLIDQTSFVAHRMRWTQVYKERLHAGHAAHWEVADAADAVAASEVDATGSEGDGDDDLDDEAAVCGSAGGSEAERASVRKFFRLRGQQKDGPSDERPVTTSQHILGLAKVPQVRMEGCRRD